MIDAVVLSSFQHGATLYARRQLAKFDPRTFAELEANGLVREKTAADVEPKPAPAPVPRAPARSRSVKPAPPLERKPAALEHPEMLDTPVASEPPEPLVNQLVNQAPVPVQEALNAADT